LCLADHSELSLMGIEGELSEAVRADNNEAMISRASVEGFLP
jgi:hypothetical protein